MVRHTVFRRPRQRAIAVYRVTTQSSEYIVGDPEQRGRRVVIVHGQPAPIASTWWCANFFAAARNAKR